MAAQAVDWWSVGVLTYELLTGASPFTVEGEKNTQQEITKRIVRCSYPVPTDVSPDVQDFIKRLLVKDPRRRLGGGEDDADELKRHPFFKDLDWEAVARREVPAPFVPALSHAADTCNFADEFTRMPPTDSPAMPPKHSDKLFLGYSYVAPSILFSENIISDEIWMQTTGQKHDKFKGWRIKDSPFFQKYAVDLSSPLLGDGSYSVCRKCIHRQTGKEYASVELSSPLLGDGSYSVCRKCIHRQTGKEYAIVSTQKKDVKQEIELLKLCQGCPYIITLHEVFHDTAFTYIVTELGIGGELASHVAGGLDERIARRLLAQLALAVRHMAALGVAHRDLKPENVLLTSCRLSEARVKVVDFGFARRLPQAEPRARMMTPCFSLPYAAPEVVSRARSHTAPGYGAQCDIWSLGVIFYVMLSGRAPFQPATPREPVPAFIDRIRAGTFTMEGPIWDKISADSKRLVGALLAVNPAARPSPEQLLQELGIHLTNTNTFQLADMTKAELYKRRNKNKQRDSHESEPSTSHEHLPVDDQPQEPSLADTITSLQNRHNNNSIDDDLQLIRAHMHPTPPHQPEPPFPEEDIPAVRPVHKTYSKSRSKPDDYMYIESSQIDDLEAAPEPEIEPSPVPKKKRKIEPKKKKDEPKAGRELRSRKSTPKKDTQPTQRKLRSRPDDARPTKESIENEKATATRATRKRKHEDTKPPLREKGQNRSKSNSETATRRTLKPKSNKQPATTTTSDAPQPDSNMRVTRARQRRIEVSLDAAEARQILPALSRSTDRPPAGKANNKPKKTTKVSKKRSLRPRRR
ncbi:protein kinase domain-containing protein [Phthorimaea operculella]|nr:protein kinase domain-containing protein [Phthorimaea operculella]